MAEATVTPIRPQLIPHQSGEVRADVVEELEKLLAEAKAGELHGIAYASLHPGDLTKYHRVGRGTRGMLGALYLLQHSIGCDVNLENG